ncbi:hypothetical protein C8R44DRAFT_894040 [Mycena epipterygia]|nr:hypothetical protein C8R44DRAFT_894040 [Mycena epipterygia]
MASGSLNDWTANLLGLNHLTLAATGWAAEDEEDAWLDDGAVEILDEDEYVG